MRSAGFHSKSHLKGSARLARAKKKRLMPPVRSAAIGNTWTALEGMRWIAVVLFAGRCCNGAQCVR